MELADALFADAFLLTNRSKRLTFGTSNDNAPLPFSQITSIDADWRS